MWNIRYVEDTLKDKLDILKQLNQDSFIVHKFGHKQEWRENKRLYGPIMDFRQYENTFKHYNYDFKTISRSHVSMQQMMSSTSKDMIS